MDRSFRNNANFKMNQQNFKLSDFGIGAKQQNSDYSTNIARSVVNSCEYSEFKVRLLSNESCTRVRVSIEGSDLSSGTESNHLTQSSKAFWKRFAAPESGVNIYQKKNKTNIYQNIQFFFNFHL